MANAPLLLDHDIAAVDRRTDRRIVLSMPARFALADRRHAEGQRREFPCRVINLSCQAMALATPVAVEVGDRVLAHTDVFGKLEGPVLRKLDGGFIMGIVAPPGERYALAAKIEWYEKHKNHDVENQREHARIVPSNPRSRLLLADGTTTDCLVRDLSASGVALDADVVPELGTLVLVGRVTGRVVRRFSDGFAVRFIEVQDAQTVAGLISRLD